MTRHTPLLIAVLALVPALVPAVTEAKPRPTPKGKRAVKAHMNRATRAHKAGKFEVALTHLEAAYALEPQPKLLFAIAQVQAKLDRCDGAIDNYERFLATTKDKNQRAVVKQAIAACKSKLAAAASATAEPEPSPATEQVFRDTKRQPHAVEASASATTTTTTTTDTGPAPTGAVEASPAPLAPAAPIVDDAPPGLGPRDAPASRGGSPWYTDVLGDALVVSGVAAGAISFVMYRRARGDLDAAETAASLDQYQDLVDRAHERRTYAVILAGGSAVLFGAGLLRYALRDTGEARGVAVAPTTGGGLVTWSGGF